MMSVGSTAPKSQGTPPHSIVSRFTRPAASGTDGHGRISIKISRPKASKAKYLTVSELTGIGLSIILSIAFSLCIVYVFVTVSPIAVDFVKSVLYDESHGTTDRSSNIGQLKLSEYVTVQPYDCNIKLPRSNPAVFANSRGKHDYDNIVNILQSSSQDAMFEVRKVEELFNNGAESKFLAGSVVDEGPFVAEGTQPREIHSGSFHVSYKEFIDFEFSINPVFEPGNHFVGSRMHRVSQLPDFKAFLEVSKVFPREAFSTCTPKDPTWPLHDFVPISISIGKNISGFTGSSFHAHRQSLSELVYGRKHWVLFPPEKVPNNGFNDSENLEQWLQQTYPRLSAKDVQPVEIMQEAGQVVYIPEGWYHATRTLSNESLSVRYESMQEVPGQYFFYLSRGDQKAAKGDFQGAVKLYRLGVAMQKDTLLLQHLGFSLEKLGLYAEAEDAYKEALKRNPRNAFNYVLLINLFVSHSSSDASVRVGEMLQAADQHQLKDRVLKMMNDAF
jgi:hypothetical protein